MNYITTYKDYAPAQTLKASIRSQFRKLALYGLSQLSSIDKTNNWIRLPYYHHVFDDEKRDFERQLKYLKNFGEFISIDDACDLIAANDPISGRYFCVSFDDGYRCCYTNMMEVTANLDIPVIIYLPTDYTGLNENDPADIVKIKQNYPENPNLELFLTWEQCREMLQHKISFGSHTCGHVNLIQLTDVQIEQELLLSKNKIEHELSVPCVHFACPWGQVDVNFSPTVTKPIAQKLGYKSFATTHRGKMQQGDDLFQLRRDHLLAGWENYQLNYFFSK